MLQEIIVYIILLFTALHMLHQSFLFFKPAKRTKKGSSCASGSCSNCAMKIDFDTIQPEHHNHRYSKKNFIQIKSLD